MSAHEFSQIPRAEIPRATFDRSHGHKTTLDAGWLVPFFVDEALPGDTFNLKAHAVARLATPIFPLMDNLYVDTFFFFVPYRLVWTNWVKFCGERKNPADSIDYTVPEIEDTVSVGTTYDYMGLPLSIADYRFNALAFRAYGLIWNEWFRDQNLQNSVDIEEDTDSVSVAPQYAQLRRRGKRHDYFTSSLPWPQKGDAVDIPLGTQAPVLGLYTSGNTVSISGTAVGGTATGTTSVSGGTDLKVASKSAVGTAASTAFNSTNANIYADLSNATAATINTLRQAFQVQKILERDARGGTRYTELVKSHFGVTSPDARLQRPEYLGGHSQPMVISEIHQTAPAAGGSTPLGQVGAIGRAHLDGNRNGFTSSFTEHGVIIGLVNVRADLTYQQQLNRMWSRRTRYDFYWPALAQIGEQAVLNKEMWFNNDAADNNVWGYQERYAEYRYKPSTVTGQFRSDAATPLDAWHLALDYTTRPVLNATFIQDNPPVDRVVAVPSEPHIILDAWFELKTARPMPVYGVPGMIDHF